MTRSSGTSVAGRGCWPVAGGGPDGGPDESAASGAGGCAPGGDNSRPGAGGRAALAEANGPQSGGGEGGRADKAAHADRVAGGAVAQQQCVVVIGRGGGGRRGLIDAAELDHLARHVHTVNGGQHLAHFAAAGALKVGAVVEHQLEVDGRI